MDEINLDDGSELDEPGITAEVDLSEETDTTTTPEAPEEKPVEKDEIDYKERYAASTREFQKLQQRQKEAEGFTLQEKARADKLQKELEDTMSRLKSEDPQTYDAMTLKQALDKNSLELAQLKEKVTLDDFISDQPLAKNFRTALQSHARAFPTKSLTEIWDESFKDIAELKEKSVEESKAQKKRMQPARGGATADPLAKTIGGYSEAEFNKLPVEKRREILVSMEVL